MRILLAAFLALLAGPALAQRVVETASGEPIFLASGAPRTDFARAYIPDGGTNADIFARDLGYLGIAHRQYVRLTDANIVKALQDPDMVAVVPASLLGAAPLGFLFEGGYFAFEATPGGLAPLEVRRPDGKVLAPLDLGPLAAAPPPVVGPDRRRTTFVAATQLPKAGALDLHLYALRADRNLLAPVLKKAGLSLGRSALVGADRIAAGPQRGGPALMFMAASQNDPALSQVMARGDLAFYAITNFGLVPARPAAANAAQAADAAPAPSKPAIKAAAPPARSPAPSESPRPAQAKRPVAAAPSAPPAPDDLAVNLPAARPARFDPADYDAVVLATPIPLKPDALKRIELVWRFLVGQGAARQDFRFFDPTEKDRVNHMLARIGAVSHTSPMTGGVFSSLTIPGAAMPDQIVKNLARTGRGLILRLEDLASPELAFFRDDPRFAFWQPTVGGFARVAIAPPPRFDAVALADLPDAAPVALVRKGKAPDAAASVGELFIASRAAHSGSPSPSLHRRKSPDSEGRQRLARQLQRDPAAIVGTGLVAKLDGESGLILEPWPADMILMTAGDLRAPLMEQVLDGADAYLVAYGQRTPILGAPPPTDLAPEGAQATRAERAALAVEQGPLIALPRDGGAHRVTLGMLSPHALFLERAGEGYRLVSNGWKGAERIVSLAAAIDMNDPIGTKARLAAIFAQPNVAVLLNHNPVAVPANDLGLPIYDALFDGARRFIRLADGVEAAMPTHPAFAPPPPSPPKNDGAFCGQSGAFALYLLGKPREPFGVLATDLAAIPMARTALKLGHVRIVPAPGPDKRATGLKLRTMAFSSPAVAQSFFADEAICAKAKAIPLP